MTFDLNDLAHLGITVATVLSAVYLGFKWFMATWIEDKFKRRLAALDDVFKTLNRPGFRGGRLV